MYGGRSWCLWLWCWFAGGTVDEGRQVFCTSTSAFLSCCTMLHHVAPCCNCIFSHHCLHLFARESRDKLTARVGKHPPHCHSAFSEAMCKMMNERMCFFLAKSEELLQCISKSCMMRPVQKVFMCISALWMQYRRHAGWQQHTSLEAALRQH